MGRQHFHVVLGGWGLAVLCSGAGHIQIAALSASTSATSCLVESRASSDPRVVSARMDALLEQSEAYARLFRGTVRAITLSEVNCLLELEPQFTPPDPTHIGVFGGCYAVSKETTQHIIMSSSN